MVDLEQPVALERSQPELFTRPDPLHGKSSLSQPLTDVGRIEAHVIALAEGALALDGRRDGRVLVGRGARVIERDHDEAPAAGRRYAAQLPHRRCIVVDVLEHVRADHRVEAGVRQVERGEVEMEVDPRLRDVGGHVAQVIHVF